MAGRASNRAKAAALLAACLLALSLAPRGFGLDVEIDQQRGSHALLRIGVATLKIAFASGQECPKTNSCPALLS